MSTLKVNAVQNLSDEAYLRPNAGTAQATTSGTEFDFIGIPSWVKKITVMFDQVSFGASGDHIIVQLGTSGGFVTSGYVSNSNTDDAGTQNSTAGLVVRGTAAGDSFIGIMTIVNVTGTEWVASHAAQVINATLGAFGGGRVDAAGVVTQVRVTGASGTVFDAGQVNIIYE